MIEIMGKIVLCLILALLLGFLIGWLFSKALQTEVHNLDEDGISENEHRLNTSIAELEIKYAKEKQMVKEYSNKNRELKGELMKKMSLLQTTSDTLKNLQSHNESSGSNKDKVAELEKLLEKKERELMEFESVLVKAEETISQLSSKK